MTEQRTTSKYHIEADTETEFLRQIGEKLLTARYHIQAETMGELLDKVAECLPRATFDNVAIEVPKGENCEDGGLQRVEEYQAKAMDLACKLFCSMVVTDLLEEDDVSTFPPPELRLLFAKTLYNIKRQFRKYNTWGGYSPFSDEESRRITEWDKAIGGYSDFKEILERELKSLTELEAECLLNLVYYELRDKGDKDLNARLEMIDVYSGRNNYFDAMMRIQGFNEFPENLLAILIEGQFRDVQDIVNQPGCLVFVPSQKRGIVLFDGDSHQGSEWFAAENFEEALNHLGWSL